mmetsp:Transcript_38592/g.110800  ORF Transcript_38592/g.110800 Transcript_38592/m.110800 type:complete len:209 (-) Transcript_38592:429-1055(-)
MLLLCLRLRLTQLVKLLVKLKLLVLIIRIRLCLRLSLSLDLDLELTILDLLDLFLNGQAILACVREHVVVRGPRPLERARLARGLVIGCTALGAFSSLVVAALLALAMTAARPARHRAAQEVAQQALAEGARGRGLLGRLHEEPLAGDHPTAALCHRLPAAALSRQILRQGAERLPVGVFGQELVHALDLRRVTLRRRWRPSRTRRGG